MRVFIALLVFVAAFFATTEATVGAMSMLTKVAASESIPALQMQNNGQRLLRERNDDEVDSEERAFIDFQKIGDAVKSFFSEKHRLINLLKADVKDDVLLKMEVAPKSLKDAVEKSKNKLSDDQYIKFTGRGDTYESHWYGNGPF